MISPTESEILARAVDLASANVADDGGPFGAVVATAEGRLVDGVNRVTATHDPTAHAEVAAIRAACAQLGTFELPGAVLYASCEPCPMCLATALWARIDRVVFAAGRDDAARAGFDDAAFYTYFERPGQQALLRTEQVRHADAVSPFEAWRVHEGRTDY
mgnify:CR=1 FL=1